MKKTSGFTIVELAIVGIIFFLMAIMLTPFVRVAKMHAAKINCTNNLMRLSLAVHKYALEHDDKFPPSLKALYPEYVKDAKVFDCPASKNIGTPDVTDYIYTDGLSETSPDKEIIIRDLDGNHKDGGSNIVRINGAVEWVDTARQAAR